MTPAGQLAMTRFLVAVAGVALPIAVGTALRLTGANTAMSAAVGGLALIGGTVLFFWMLFVWRPRCPQCGVAAATRFVREGDVQRLRCTRCAYDEPTGWTYGD